MRIDENALLRDTSEVLTIKLEKYKISPNVCDLSQKNGHETQTSLQFEAHQQPSYFQPYEKTQNEETI